MRKIMTPYDSRAIAKDINQPPFSDLPYEAQWSIRHMFGNEIVTFDEWDIPVHKPKVETKPFTDQIKEFIQSVTWTFAKTMPDWPHEYIVRHQVDKELFLEMVNHIREYGYLGIFYDKTLTYFNEAGKVYWTMGETLDKTIVINRCREEDTYENRRKNGTLPQIKTE